MAATNIFYRIPSQRGIRVASIAGTGCTLDQFCDYIIDSEGFNRDDFIIASGTKVFRPSSCNLQSVSIQNNSHIDILIPLLGGKGGFGSLLRAIGAQIEKTTNRDACRDLSGRRLRDVKREEELRNLIALQEKLQEERKRRRKEKLEKLKKKSESSQTSTSIQELVSLFDDHAYNQRRLQISEIIDAAVEKGIINSKKREAEELCQEQGKKVKLEEKPTTTANVDVPNGDGEEDGESKQCIHKQSKMQKPTADSPDRTSKAKIKKNDFWLGLEDDEI